MVSTPFPSLRAAISAAHLEDEAACVDRLLHRAALDGAAQWRVEGAAARLVRAAREQRLAYSELDAFLHEYDLSSQEGVVLMCLAEALLRIPDADTADRLIRDKFTDTDWFRHLGHSRSLLVNASTWGLLLTGGMVKLEKGAVSLMTTKHCLRFSFNLCPKQVPGTRPDPLTLMNGNEKLTLRFDCKRCEMHVEGKLKSARQGVQI